PVDTDTATVTSTGLLSGVEVGSTTVTATKDGVVSNAINVDVTAAVITAIQVTPATVNIAKGQTQQLVAMATYSDATSSDVTNSVAWSPVDTDTATVTSTGLLSGVASGSTTVTAMKGGITSNTVTVKVCDFAGACIDIFDVGGGKLYTSSPSVAYLDSIGGEVATSGIATENGLFGPVGDFYKFNESDANVLCATYNANSLAERTNWRLATRSELRSDLYLKYGDMFVARGWPNIDIYRVGGGFVSLRSGGVGPLLELSPTYATCTSEL
ncbi:Ig-like domain-containing protein, partial [Vibrio crassostreae]